jgi:hypothetical protein
MEWTARHTALGFNSKFTDISPRIRWSVRLIGSPISLEPLSSKPRISFRLSVAFLPLWNLTLTQLISIVFTGQVGGDVMTQDECQEEVST